MGGSRAYRVKSEQVPGGGIKSAINNPLERINKPWSEMSQNEKQRVVVAYVKEAWGQPDFYSTEIRTDGESVYVDVFKIEPEFDGNGNPLYYWDDWMLESYNGDMREVAGNATTYSDYLSSPSHTSSGKTVLDEMVNNIDKYYKALR